MRSITAIAAAALLLVGCAGRGGPGAQPGPGEPTSTVLPSPTGPIPEPSPSIVRPREGLVDPRPVALEGIEPLEPDRLLATFYGGVEECYGVARVDVEETSDTVTITVYEGHVPEAEVCIDIALLKGVVVTLEAPLGDREVVDGAA